MFVRHSVHVDHPIVACTEVLMSGPRKGFPRLGGKDVGSVSVHIGGVPVRKRVVVTLGEPVKTATWTVIPLDWKATFPQQLFPKLTGRIALAPADATASRLTVGGMCDPPLEKLGKQMNETLMQGVANATVKELAEAIAKRLDAAVSAKARKLIEA